MADILSLEDDDGLRCVDIVAGEDGAFGFKEFRRDPEDGGGWTLVTDCTAVRYATREDALQAAVRTLAWARMAGAILRAAQPGRLGQVSEEDR